MPQNMMALVVLLLLSVLCGLGRCQDCNTVGNRIRTDPDVASCTDVYTVVVREQNVTSPQHLNDSIVSVCGNMTCRDLTRQYLAECYPLPVDMSARIARIPPEELDFDCRRINGSADYCGNYRDIIPMELMDCGVLEDTITDTDCGPSDSNCAQELLAAYDSYGCCVTEYLAYRFSQSNMTNSTVGVARLMTVCQIPSAQLCMDKCYQTTIVTDAACAAAVEPFLASGDITVGLGAVAVPGCLGLISDYLICSNLNPNTYKRGNVANLLLLSPLLELDTIVDSTTGNSCGSFLPTVVPISASIPTACVPACSAACNQSLASLSAIGCCSREIYTRLFSLIGVPSSLATQIFSSCFPDEPPMCIQPPSAACIAANNTLFNKDDDCSKAAAVLLPSLGSRTSDLNTLNSNIDSMCTTQGCRALVSDQLLNCTMSSDGAAANSQLLTEFGCRVSSSKGNCYALLGSGAFAAVETAFSVTCQGLVAANCTSECQQVLSGALISGECCLYEYGRYILSTNNIQVPIDFVFTLCGIENPKECDEIKESGAAMIRSVWLLVLSLAALALHSS